MVENLLKHIVNSRISTVTFMPNQTQQMTFCFRSRIQCPLIHIHCEEQRTEATLMELWYQSHNQPECSETNVWAKKMLDRERADHSCQCSERMLRSTKRGAEEEMCTCVCFHWVCVCVRSWVQALHSTMASSKLRDMYGVYNREVRKLVSNPRHIVLVVVFGRERERERFQ